MFVRCDERGKGKVGYKLRTRLCSVLPASYLSSTKTEGCFDESAWPAQWRRAHNIHVHTHASYYITRARAHTFSSILFLFFSLTHSYLIRLYIAPLKKERDIFFSLSRVRSPLSFSVSRVSAKAVHAKSTRELLFPRVCSLIPNEYFVFSRSPFFLRILLPTLIENGRRRVLQTSTRAYHLSSSSLYREPKLP